VTDAGLLLRRDEEQALPRFFVENACGSDLTVVQARRLCSVLGANPREGEKRNVKACWLKALVTHTHGGESVEVQEELLKHLGAMVKPSEPDVELLDVLEAMTAETPSNAKEFTDLRRSVELAVDSAIVADLFGPGQKRKSQAEVQLPVASEAPSFATDVRMKRYMPPVGWIVRYDKFKYYRVGYPPKLTFSVVYEGLVYSYTELQALEKVLQWVWRQHAVATGPRRRGGEARILSRNGACTQMQTQTHRQT
jgi:hypothetical protein